MLQVYKNQNIGQAQLNAPQMRSITTGGVAGLMPTDNIVMGKKAMGAIFDAMAERQRVQDNTDLAAASSELQKQVIAFQSQYRQQNMGRDARDAGDVWAQNVGELAGKIGEQFQGRPDLQARFKQAANEMALRSYASGFSYADGEEAKYRDATREEKLAILNDAIGNGTPMDIASAKQDYEATLALLYPGRNLQPELMAADRLVAGGLIDRALAENDIREARALYKEQRDQLGKDAPSYLSKIDAKAEALEKRWEKAQKEAEAAKFEQDVATQSAEVLKQVNEFPDLDWEEKEAKAVQLTKDIEDPKVRAEIRKRLAADFKEQAITHKANVTLELDELDKLIHQTGPDGSQLTISAQLGAIQSANVSEEAKRRATKGVYDRLNGEDNTALSSSGLAAWRQWRDGEGFTASPEEQRAMMLDLGLNEKDRKAASEYEGLRVEYSQARVFGLITSVYKELTNKPDQLNRIYEAVLAQAKDSKKPLTDKELRDLIWLQKNVEVYIEGAYTGPFGGHNMMTFLEGFEQTEGQIGQLRFEIPEDTAKVLRKQVELIHPWSRDASFLPKYREELLQATYLRMQGITPELSKDTQNAIIKAQEKYNKRMGLR